VHDLLDAKANAVTVRLVEVAIGGFGGRNFEGSLTRLVELVAQRRDRELAYVTAAVLPTDDEEQRLVELLSRMYGRNVSLKVKVEPEIIGGMSVRVGADLYDGTVLRRLTEARQALTR
jgi:F-type H+-transporting ATPase subunit delta